MDVRSRAVALTLNAQGRLEVGGGADRGLVAIVSPDTGAVHRIMSYADEPLRDIVAVVLMPLARRVIEADGLDMDATTVARWIAEAMIGPQAEPVYTDADQARLRQLGSVARFWAALERRQLRLVAQPIRSLRRPVSRSATADVRYELLLRLPQADSPGRMLEDLGRLGVAGTVDRWVVEQAIGLLGRYPQTSFNVNVEASSATSALLAAIEDGIRTVRVPVLDRLCIEITERQPLQPEFLDGVVRLGCPLALDDFGSGYYSHNAFRVEPFRYVKFAGDLISEARSVPAAREVVAALVAYARGQQTETVAEHVPDLDAYELVRRLGFDHGQGHFAGLGMPGPIEDWLEPHRDRRLSGRFESIQYGDDQPRHGRSAST